MSCDSNDDALAVKSDVTSSTIAVTNVSMSSADKQQSSVWGEGVPVFCPGCGRAEKRMFSVGVSRH